MELSKEQEERIILQVIERILNKMPEVIGNLMSQRAVMNKLKKEFFDGNPEFKDHKEIVGQVLADVEGNDITLDYEQIFKKAKPEISKRIQMKQETDLTNVKRKSDVETVVRTEDRKQSHGEL